MVRVHILKAEMDESSGKLDQSFIEGVIGGLPANLEPEVLQHIMSLVVSLGIKTLEVAEIAGIEGTLAATSLQFFHEELHPF
jgi:hypothetical protein